tara:strand:- start:366 stop:521 length:156 start_codon:yes stop_codon:yes gene_type:complete
VGVKLMDKKHLPRMNENQKESKGVVWHIYHTILALLLAGVLIVEVIELWLK